MTVLSRRDFICQGACGVTAACSRTMHDEYRLMATAAEQAACACKGEKDVRAMKPRKQSK